ncbi:MAG: CBS domain-containing protein [Magnetovibrionaceae bacterium]
MKVRDLIERFQRKAITAKVDETIRTVANRMVENRIGAVAVVGPDGSSMVGLLSERDVMRAISEYPYEVADLSIGQYATTRLRTCTQDDEAADVLATMLGQGFRHMPVVRDGIAKEDATSGDHLVAVLSIKDLAQALILEKPS